MRKICITCKKEFDSHSNRQMRCEDCQRKYRKQYIKKYKEADLKIKRERNRILKDARIAVKNL